MNEHESKGAAADSGRLEDRGLVRDLRRATATLDAQYDPARKAALIERVLSTTTRAEPAPLLSFDGLRGALGRSGLMKLVAASLVLHLGALSVVAMLAIREPRKPLLVSVQPQRSEDLLVEEVEVLPPVVGPDELERVVLDRQANRVRLDRFLAARDTDELVAAQALASGLASDVRSACAARAAALETRSWKQGMASLRSDAFEAELPDLIEVVQTAALLDAFLFTGEHGGLPSRLARLARLEGAADPGLAGAAARVLERGRGYGLWQGSPSFDQHPLFDVLER